MIRAYRSSDLDDLLATWATASEVAHPFLSEEFLHQESRNIPEIYLPIAETWVWEEDYRVVGLIALIGDEVGALFVDPSFHRRGIGSQLLDWARARRGSLDVDVFRENRIGRAFYAKHGFKPLTEEFHESSGHVMMRLRLPAANKTDSGQLPGN